jgi:streptogramin lyase
MAIDRLGNLYFADANNHVIRRISPDAVIMTVAGNGVEGFSGDGGPATSASLNYPEDVAIDASGNLFIADSANNRVRKVGPSGIISSVAGTGLDGFSGDGGPSVEAMLNFPWGLTTDASGGVYIADRVNNRIRKISPSISSAPVLPENSTVNGASFAKNFAIAPGAISLFSGRI